MKKDSLFVDNIVKKENLKSNKVAAIKSAVQDFNFHNQHIW